MAPQLVTNHEQIRRWAAARNAFPAEVFSALHDGEPAILRFAFGNVPEAPPALRPELRRISWESFFAQFDALGLALAVDGGGGYELVQMEEKSPYRFEGKPL